MKFESERVDLPLAEELKLGSFLMSALQEAQEKSADTQQLYKLDFTVAQALLETLRYSTCSSNEYEIARSLAQAEVELKGQRGLVDFIVAGFDRRSDGRVGWEVAPSQYAAALILALEQGLVEFPVPDRSPKESFIH